MIIFLIYIAVLAAMSLIAFITYGIDKWKAINGRWRISEAALLGLSFLGGALGGILAMNVFRHKTRHWYFWVANITFLLLHIAAAIVICVKLI